MNPAEFLDSLINYEKIRGYNYNLQDFIEFLALCDSPQEKIDNVVHIAGTKGKGSTAAIISSCLSSCGYKVGLFTSPHLKRLNERIKINKVEISNKDLSKYIKQIKPHIKKKHGVNPVKYRKLSEANPIKYQKFHGARTFFEVVTTIAFLHFLKHKTDFSILEVGLGGRLDATNVTKPLLSVMTKVGYDHTDLLGNTLSQIASEKAGIIKTNGRLITGHQRPAVQKIINRIARAKNCSIIFAEDQHEIKVIKYTIKGSHFRIKGEIGEFRTFLPLVGQHQKQNLQIALCVLNELKKSGFRITSSSVQKGIRKTHFPGRFSTLSKNPLVIYDCAHNQESFEVLRKNIDILRIKNYHLIFGCSRGKNIDYCLKYIFPKAKEVLLVKANHPRAIDPVELYKKAKRFQKKISIAPSVQKAVEHAKNKANNNSAVIITGSFYLWQKNWNI